MALVLRRTAIFLTIVMLWALLAAAVAHAQQPQPAKPPEAAKQSQPVQQVEPPKRRNPSRPNSPLRSCRFPATAPAPSW